MTRDDAHAALQGAMAAIRDAAETLRPHTSLFECYARERVEADAIVGPTFDAARQFLRAIETQTLRALESALKRASQEER